jgi:hypothetical protein
MAIPVPELAGDSFGFYYLPLNEALEIICRDEFGYVKKVVFGCVPLHVYFVGIHHTAAPSFPTPPTCTLALAFIPLDACVYTI